MKKNLFTTLAISCAFVLGGMFTSCSGLEDNPIVPIEEVTDFVAEKLCQEKTWIDRNNIVVQNGLWVYTFNEDGTILISGLTKFGDPDQLLNVNFSGNWKPVTDYKDNYNVVNSNVSCYAVELKLYSFYIDEEEFIVDDPTIYKDTLLVEYKGGEIRLCMASDIKRYLDHKVSTRGTESDLWSLVKVAVAAGMISEEELIETCVEIISNLSEEEINEILINLTDEDIQELIAIMEELTGEDYSDIIKGDADDDGGDDAGDDGGDDGGDEE